MIDIQALIDQAKEDKEYNDFYDMTFNDMLLDYYEHKEEYDAMEEDEELDPDDIEDNDPACQNPQFRVITGKHP